MVANVFATPSTTKGCVCVIEEMLEADQEDGGETEGVQGFIRGGYVQRVWGERDQQADESYGELLGEIQLQHVSLNTTNIPSNR